MRIFNELVVDDFVESTATHLGQMHWQAVMGNIDVFRFIVVADRVSGTAPTLRLSIADTPNMGNLIFPPAAKTLLNNSLLTVGQTNTFQAELTEADGIPLSYGAALLYTLGGTTPKAHVRVWVTGRGRA